MKQEYEKPLAELYLIQCEGSLLYNTSVEQVQSMTRKSGSWDDDDLDW